MAKTTKGEKNEITTDSIAENQVVENNYTNVIAKEADVSVETKLIALYTLQQIDSQIDKIRIIRGELPLEVQDLEDEIIGLETRIDNFIIEIKGLETSISDKTASISDCQMLIKRYEDQQNNVRNNREYDSLTK
jgi:predicted  nucleic acid-binding Zn-ribbon protein